MYYTFFLMKITLTKKKKKETYIYQKKEYWTTNGLSTVASGVGRPLYPDAITRACTRLDFARVCVMIDVAQTLPKHIIVMTPDENGGETPCKVDVEYEWLPPKCTNCMILGHMTKDCPLNKIHKPSKPPVAVYVAKTNTPLPQPNNEKSRKPMRQTMVDIPRREEGEVHRERKPDKHDDRGKALVIYNAFDALQLIDDAGESSRGPNTSSPINHDPC